MTVACSWPEPGCEPEHGHAMVSVGPDLLLPGITWACSAGTWTAGAAAAGPEAMVSAGTPWSVPVRPALWRYGLVRSLVILVFSDKEVRYGKNRC